MSFEHSILIVIVTTNCWWQFKIHTPVLLEWHGVHRGWFRRKGQYFGRWFYWPLWKKKFPMNTCLILNQDRRWDVRKQNCKSIVNGDEEKAITYC